LDGVRGGHAARRGPASGRERRRGRPPRPDDLARLRLDPVHDLRGLERDRERRGRVLGRRRGVPDGARGVGRGRRSARHPRVVPGDTQGISTSSFGNIVTFAWNAAGQLPTGVTTVAIRVVPTDPFVTGASVFSVTFTAGNPPPPPPPPTPSVIVDRPAHSASG